MGVVVIVDVVDVVVVVCWIGVDDGFMCSWLD
jgi:hypothetical protein